MAEALGRIVALTGRRIDRRISDRVLRGAHGLEVSGGDVEDLAQVAAGLERRRLTRRNQLQVAVRRVAVDLQRDAGRAVDALRRQLLPGRHVEQVAVPGLVEVGRPDHERVARGLVERQVQRHLAGGAEVLYGRCLGIRIVHLDRHGSDGGVRKPLDEGPVARQVRERIRAGETAARCVREGAVGIQCERAGVKRARQHPRG